MIKTKVAFLKGLLLSSHIKRDFSKTELFVESSDFSERHCELDRMAMELIHKVSFV